MISGKRLIGSTAKNPPVQLCGILAAEWQSAFLMGYQSALKAYFL